MHAWIRGVFLLGLVAAPAWGATPLTWQACVEEAAANNAELRSARESHDAAVLSARGSYSGFFPTVTGSVDLDRSSTSSVASDSTGLRLSASQNLFTGFQDRARVDRAAAEARSTESSLGARRAKVSADLKTAYADLLYAQRSVELQRDILRRRAENLRLVELRFESGRENKGSVLLSKAYNDQANYDVLRSRNGLGVARAELSRILGREEGDLVAADDLPETMPEADPDFRKLAAAVPDHLRSMAEEEASAASLALARGEFFPTLSLNGSLGRTDDVWVPKKDRWTVGVSLSLPLFAGGKDFYATRSAGATFRAATATRTEAARQALVSLRQRHAALLEAVEKVKVDESFQLAARARAEIARHRYNNGLISFEDWDLIENDLMARQRAWLQSRRDRVAAEAAWEQAQGKGVIP